ncbi:MAG: DUF2127 domain-containing protein [Gemmatimonadaceae bacterium]
MSQHIAPTARTRGILDLIAVFKFVKAGALIAAGLGGIGLLNANVEQAAESWLEYLALGHAPKLLAELAAKLLPQLDAATPRRFVVLAIGAFAYAAVFMVEGIGLIRARRWAEFLTIGVTISFLPFETYVLVEKQTWPRIVALTLNIAVVVYLIWRVRADRAAERITVNAETSSQ